MRRILLAAAVGFTALAGAAGLAMAQDGPGPRGPHGLFQADANNDGALTRREFDAGRDAMFARLDADSDGQIAREEMRARYEGRRGGRRHGGMHSMRGADANNDGNITREEFLARPSEHFDRLDANNDGVISADERPQRGERAGRRGRGERPNLDANSDGQVSRAEFAAAGAAMFERLDADNDGRVTREEAAAAHQHRRGR